MTKRDKEELALYRRLAEINGRLDALKAIEAIKDAIRRNKRFDSPLTLIEPETTA